MILIVVSLQACGGSSSPHYDNYPNSKESLSQYNGKWELFQIGNKAGTSETFRLTLRGSNSAEIKYWETGPGFDKIIVEGEGDAYLNGNTIIVTIKRGYSKGSAYEFKIRNGVITLANGAPLSKKSY